MSIKNILWALILGLISGLLISFYFLGLYKVNFHLWQHPGLTVLLPFVFLALIFIRRSTDFIPVSFKEMREASIAETHTWSRWTLPINLVVSWASHLVGASLGRESTATVVSTTVIPIFKLDWAYWRPIVLSSSLAMATGFPLVAFVILIELFFSSFQQKLLTVLAAWVGCLVMKSLAVPPLFLYGQIDVNNKSFFSALVLTFAVGICCGYSGRIYKFLVEWLKAKFQNFRTRSQILIGLLLTIFLTGVIIKFDLSSYQSLSLPQFSLIETGKISQEFFLIKGLLTILFVALGFVGGEFVPSLLIGSAIGATLSPILSENIGFGFALGVFTFFAALSKMKWTALCLVWAYFDIYTAMWAYFAISISDSLSGDRKLF